MFQLLKPFEEADGHQEQEHMQNEFRQLQVQHKDMQSRTHVVIDQIGQIKDMLRALPLSEMSKRVA
jgi:hypothetical protein